MPFRVLEVLDALNVLGPFIDGASWVFSPSFRARKREEWSQRGLGRRIGEIAFWVICWLFAIILATMLLLQLRHN